MADWTKGEKRPFKFDPNSTENEGRFRLYPPEKLTDYTRWGSSTKGVSYVVGKDADGKSVTQAIRFDRDIFTEEKARTWWNENRSRFKFYDE